MASQGFEMVRYADDFVILCRTAAEAAQALEIVKHWTSDNGLTLHPPKTKIVDVRTDGFDFLGYHFIGTKHWPREKSLKKLKDTLRVKTKRTSGQSLQFIVTDVNRTLRGWFAYFQHGLAEQFVDRQPPFGHDRNGPSLRIDPVRREVDAGVLEHRGREVLRANRAILDVVAA